MNGSRGLQRKEMLVLGLMLITCSAQGVAQAQRLSTKGCARVLLTNPEPLKISSAAYVDSLDKVAVVDPMRSNILLIDQKGKTQIYDPKRLVNSDKDVFPAILNRMDQGFALTMTDERLYRLDRNLDKIGVEDITTPGASTQVSILSTYDFVNTGNSFFSFGAIGGADGKMRIGFFRASSTAPASPEFLLDVEETDYYLLWPGYLTGLGRDQYAVLMSPSKPVILRFSPDGSRHTLDVIPDRYKHAPEIKNIATGPSSEAAMYKEIESLTIPVGLFGQDEFLYLLTREPGQGGTPGGTSSGSIRKAFSEPGEWSSLRPRIISRWSTRAATGTSLRRDLLKGLVSKRLHRCSSCPTLLFAPSPCRARVKQCGKPLLQAFFARLVPASNVTDMGQPAHGPRPKTWLLIQAPGDLQKPRVASRSGFPEQFCMLERFFRAGPVPASPVDVGDVSPGVALEPQAPALFAGSPLGDQEGQVRQLQRLVRAAGQRLDALGAEPLAERPFLESP